MRPRTKKERFRRHLLAVFFPERCACCGQVIVPLSEVCLTCREHLPLNLPPLCPQCGRSAVSCSCGGHQHAFDACTAPFLYKDPVRKGLLFFKHTPNVFTVEFLAQKMAQCVHRDFGGQIFDCIVPVPITEKCRRIRGYNQSELLAEELAKILQLPVVPYLKKIYETEPQKTLSQRLRSGNVLGAFDVDSSLLDSKQILLVDDILTTGSTMNECAKMLKIYGAETVVALVAAVDPPMEKEKNHDGNQRDTDEGDCENSYGFSDEIRYSASERLSEK